MNPQPNPPSLQAIIINLADADEQPDRAILERYAPYIETICKSNDWNKDQPNSNTEPQTGINGAGPDELDGITQQLYDGELNPAEAKAALQALSDRRTKEVLDSIRKWTAYNKHDMGELGEFIRTQYVYNKLGEEQTKLNQEGH